MKRNRIITSILLAAFAWPLAAQESAAQSEEVQELEVRATEYIFVEGSLPYVPASNTIASKLPLTLEQTPNNVGLVTRTLFDEQYGQVLGDALRNVSNVNIQPGFGVQDYFVIRGFDSLSSSLVLTDGAPEPEATFYQLYNVELVEVLKGPGGFLYGSNPLAGAVNLVRKQPTAMNHMRFGAAAGSFATMEATADANWASADRTSLGRVNLLYRDAGSWRDNKDSTVLGVNPSFTWRPDDDRSLTLNFEYLKSDFTPDAGVPILFGETVDVDPGTDYNSPLDRSEQDVLRFQVDYETRVSDTLTVRNKTYYRGLDWTSDGTLLVGAVPLLVGGNEISFAVLRTQVQLLDDQDVVGNQLEAILDVDAGSTHHNLLGGLEVTRHADAYSLDVGFLQPVTLFDPQPDPTPAFPIPGQAVSGKPRSVVFAPYLIDQITFSDRFQLLAGMRFDSIDFEDALLGTERNDTEFSPMLGAVVMPTTNVAVYGNFSRSFAPPSARAFGDLRPEESQQLEAGVKLWFLDRRARATAAVYHLERQNIAIPDDNGFTQQIGNQDARGFELELAVEPARGVRTVASYAYNDAELTEFAEVVLVPVQTGDLVPTVIDRSGNRPAFAPEHLFNVWASKSFARGLVVGAGGRYVGSQFIAEDNAFEIPDAFIASGMLAYDWADYRLSVNVQNATDTTYLLRGFGAQSVTPGSPLAVFVRFSIVP